jgi:class 3 adenylate cyclase
MHSDDPKTLLKPHLLNLSSFAARLLGGAMIAVVFLVLLTFVAPFIDDANSYTYLRGALTLEHKIEEAVRSNIPTRISGKDMTKWVLIVGMFILSGSLSRAGERFHNSAEYLRYKANLETWKAGRNLSDDATSPLNQKLEQIKTAKRRDREELLKDFAEAKRRLDEMGRDLAFLSIDVVDSTGLKMGEERAAVEHDFNAYKRFVDTKLSAHGCLKSTWTPDGVMSCFTSVDAAVRAAREVINGLELFNANVKTMRRHFHVRCGVNLGFVYFDDHMGLEEISDRVIDTAAHIQKKARPDTVSVSKPAIEPLNERVGFEPTGAVVDGYEVYEWRKL